VTAGADRARSARAEGAPPAHHVLRFQDVDSTQTVALALAADGAADGTVVVADFQRRGRGRRGHVWLASPGTSLLMSVVIRPRVISREVPLYSFVAAVAVADALRDTAGVVAELRWPNDVLVRRRKIAGILLEAHHLGREGHHVSAPGAAAATEPGDAGAVVVGIGVNLGQRGFPAGLGARATSVVLETGHDLDREALLTGVLARLDGWRARLEADGFTPIRARWLASSATIGRSVRIDGVSGVAVDVAPDGALVIDDGASLRHVTAGEVVDMSAPTAGPEPSHAPRR
jgi:BirA family biotin operon repressor/biotin-[acetyl-CoA-carboxylase] ligase